jgi:hypothetical protein
MVRPPCQKPGPDEPARPAPFARRWPPANQVSPDRVRRPARPSPTSKKPEETRRPPLLSTTRRSRRHSATLATSVSRCPDSSTTAASGSTTTCPRSAWPPTSSAPLRSSITFRRCSATLRSDRHSRPNGYGPRIAARCRGCGTLEQFEVNGPLQGRCSYFDGNETVECEDLEADPP